MAEVKYNLNVKPYYDTTVDELSKGYIQYLALDGQRLQNRELNVAQGLIRGTFTQLTNEFIEDGSVLSGCNFTNNKKDKICILKEGKIYLNGVIVVTPETKWSYSDDEDLKSQIPMGKVKIFADVLPTIITPADDTTLYNPAENYESFGDTGGHRLKYVAKILALTEEEFSDLLKSNSNKMIVPILDIFNREKISAVKEQPFLKKINGEMRERTYDQSGDFIAFGLKVSAKRHSNDPEHKYVAHITEGRCYVRGYQYKFEDTDLVNYNSSVNVDSTLRTGIPEKIIYSGSDYKYYLSHTYAKSVINIVAPVLYQSVLQNATDNFDTKSEIRADFINLNGKPINQIAGVSKVYNRIQENGETINIVYVPRTAGYIGDDWDYDNSMPSKLVWNISGRAKNNKYIPNNYIDNANNGIANYYADVIYSDILAESKEYDVLRDKVGLYILFKDNIQKALAIGYTFEVNYDWYNSRADLIYVSASGVLTIKQGSDTTERGFAPDPVIPTGALPLAVIYITPFKEPYNWRVSGYGLYRVPVGQLQDIKKRVERLEYNVTMSNLEKSLENKHNESYPYGEGSYNLRNIYTDPLIDYSRADTKNKNFSATINIAKSYVVLPMNIKQLSYKDMRIKIEEINEDGDIEIKEVDPSKIGITTIDRVRDSKDKKEFAKIVTSQQINATINIDTESGREIDLAPFVETVLTPKLICEPNNLTTVEDDENTVVVWLPNKIMESTSYIDTIDKIEKNYVGERIVNETTIINK